MKSLKLVSAASTYPVTLEEAKAHLRVQDDEEDTLIGLYIAAATAYAESYLGRSLIDQTWDLYLDDFPEGDTPIDIPRPPLIEVTEFDDGQSPAFSGYSVDTSGSRLYLTTPGTSWPVLQGTRNQVRIRYRAGYVDESVSPDVGSVPDDIRNAILLIIGTLYAQRETIVIGQAAVEIPFGAEALLLRHRVELSLA